MSDFKENEKVDVGAPELVVGEDAAEHTSIATVEKSAEESAPSTELLGAPLWKRSLALLVDAALIAAIPGGFLCLGSTALAIWTRLAAHSLPQFLPIAQIVYQAAAYFLIYAPLIVVIFWPLLYYVLFEGGSNQATPGKRIFGLKAISDDGGKFSYKQVGTRLSRTWMISEVGAIVFCLLAVWISPPDAYQPILFVLLGFLLCTYGTAILDPHRRRRTLIDREQQRIVVDEGWRSILKVKPTMLEIGSFAFLAISLLSCGFASANNMWLLSSEASWTSDKASPHKVNQNGIAVVPAKFIPAGSVLKKEDLKVLNKGILATPIYALGLEDAVGRTARYNLFPGAYMNDSHVVGTVYSASRVMTMAPLSEQDFLRIRMRQCNEEVKANPKQAQGYSARGWLHFRMGDTQKALADLDKAQALQDWYPATYYNRALIYAQRNDLRKALEQANEAIDRDSDYLDAYRLREKLNRKLGNKQAADEDKQQVEDLAPGEEEERLQARRNAVQDFVRMTQYYDD